MLPVPKFEPRTGQLVGTALSRLLENKFVLKVIREQEVFLMHCPFSGRYFSLRSLFFKVGLRDHHALCVHAYVRATLPFELLNRCIDFYETCYQYCGTGSSVPYILIPCNY
jgi:hypothetical protein